MRLGAALSWCRCWLLWALETAPSGLVRAVQPCLRPGCMVHRGRLCGCTAPLGAAAAPRPQCRLSSTHGFVLPGPPCPLVRGTCESLCIAVHLAATPACVWAGGRPAGFVGHSLCQSLGRGPQSVSHLVGSGRQGFPSFCGAAGGGSPTSACPTPCCPPCPHLACQFLPVGARRNFFFAGAGCVVVRLGRAWHWRRVLAGACWRLTLRTSTFVAYMT